MKYSDKFGEVIKVRLSSDDMPLLKDYVDNICDSDDMKSLLTAVLTTYLERYERHKAQADEMNYYKIQRENPFRQKRLWDELPLHEQLFVIE